MEQPDKYQLTLADILASNYINVSASKINWDYSMKHASENDIDHRHFFEKKLRENYSDENFAFSRTVLILGNGASKPFTPTTLDILDIIESRYGYHSAQLISDNDRRNSYITEAGNILGHISIPKGKDIREIKKTCSLLKVG
ncbi:MAG: hypothetical protein IPK10_16325 [Bacteroidetes bacterium]|nr:hypothetical protein [Bacteroidota bacterium]